MRKLKVKYVIVTPARNEEKYIEKTAESVISQSILPVEWIIVNDGSTDGTGSILRRYEKQNSWIRVINRENRGYRKSGSGVIEAFYDGFYKIKQKKWEFIVKLDGDLEFGKSYFEKCFLEFAKDEQLGIGGGLVLNKTINGLELERNPIFHVRGATKIYRDKCWHDIGGLKKIIGWDTLDEVHANMLGWRTRTFKNIKMIQNKLTGAADGQLRNYIKNGKANYICRYHPIFMVGKIIKRTKEKPYVVGSLGLLLGYVLCYLQKPKRIEDKTLVSYIRKQQINRILGKKSIWY